MIFYNYGRELLLQPTDVAERQGSLLRLGRRKTFIKCGEIGGGVSQERGRENEGECVELKIFKLSTCFNIIAAAAAAADGWQTPRLFGFWGTKPLRGRRRGGERGGQTQSCRKPARTDGRREANQPPAATDGCAEISANGLLSKGAECAALQGKEQM